MEELCFFDFPGSLVDSVCLYVCTCVCVWFYFLPLLALFVLLVRDGSRKRSHTQSLLGFGNQLHFFSRLSFFSFYFTSFPQLTIWPAIKNKFPHRRKTVKNKINLLRLCKTMKGAQSLTSTCLNCCSTE